MAKQSISKIHGMKRDRTSRYRMCIDGGREQTDVDEALVTAGTADGGDAVGAGVVEEIGGWAGDSVDFQAVVDFFFFSPHRTIFSPMG